jgi:bifunctional enzyme CysN/CysC
MSASAVTSRNRRKEIAAPRGDHAGRTLRDLEGIVHVLTCGSVDDGKSTLIGRLLWDTGEVADDQRARLSRGGGGDAPDFSLLVDGLLAEREQGITIDIAWRYVDAGRRRVVIIDSPGHEQYTRNMASGASHADVAIMLVDARAGIKTQTRRHAAILDLFGVRHVVLAVNKMDLVDWSEATFRTIEAEFRQLSGRFGFHEARAIPVSAKRGDNIASRSTAMPWYTGPQLLDVLQSIPSRRVRTDLPFRFPVQTVLRADDFRGLAGTVAAGRIARGVTVIDAASGKKARIARIATMDGDLDSASSGQAVVLQLDRDLDISRGAVLAIPKSAPKPGRVLNTRVVWLAEVPFVPDRRLLLRTSTDLVPIAHMTVKARLDLATLAQEAGDDCAANDIVAAKITLGRAVVADRFADVPETGAIALVDALTGATMAGGVVRAIDRPKSAGHDRSFRITRATLSDLCAGLAPSNPEYARRAKAVRRLFADAGVEARLDFDIE